MTQKTRTSLKIPILVMIAFLIGGCSEGPSQLNQNVSPGNATETPIETVGWLHGNCLSINRPDLAKGTPITIVNFDTSSAVLVGHISDIATSGESCYALLEDRQQVNRDTGASFYLVDVDAGQTVGLGIGILQSTQLSVDGENQVRGDINADGVMDYFTQCSTSEGISFAVWSAEPEKGHPLWEGYYFMGYDMEPTCSSTEE